MRTCFEQCGAKGLAGLTALLLWSAATTASATTLDEAEVLCNAALADEGAISTLSDLTRERHSGVPFIYGSVDMPGRDALRVRCRVFQNQVRELWYQDAQASNVRERSEWQDWPPAFEATPPPAVETPAPPPEAPTAAARFSKPGDAAPQPAERPEGALFSKPPQTDE